MDGFGMDIEEVTDREDEEESSHLKQSPKQPEPKRMRQVKLDTFLKCSGSMARPSSSTATSPSVVKVHSPRRSKSSFSVTTSSELLGLKRRFILFSAQILNPI
ncbi:unnamed protein product [Anisakis simplex]|uniref:Uncharacterized protein n=1 Tax=Anisakis simplex TaxID=6269 RepID=A0A0M3JIW7_ANISI|nr:unnamed protein product [Anisakis simplex]